MESQGPELQRGGKRDARCLCWRAQLQERQSGFLVFVSKCLCHTSDISDEINVSISTVRRWIASWVPHPTSVMHE